MKKFLLATTAALVLSAGFAMASPFTDQILAGLQGQGFERIEIKTGLTQVKVEAIRGTTKVEIIYDLATGAVLKQETRSVAGDDDTAPGVFIEEEAGDFLDDNGGDDSNDDGVEDDSMDDDGIDDNGGDDGADDNGDDSNDDNGDDANDDNGSDDANDDNGNDDANDDNGNDDANDDNGNDDDGEDDN